MAMSYYEQDNIKLHEAMTMELKQTLRVWSVPGIHVEVEKLPENATNIKTLAAKCSDGNFAVAVEWTAKEETKPDVESSKLSLSFDKGPGEYMKRVARKISTLEELQNKFPQLFELEGFLFALR